MTPSRVIPVAGLILLSAVLGFLALRPGGVPAVGTGAPQESESGWISQLRKPSDVIFREAVPIGRRANADSVTESSEVLVQSYGLLDEKEEAQVVASFSTQIASLDQKLAAMPPRNGNDLEAALHESSLLVQRARLESAIDMVNAKEYCTINADGPRPPEAHGHDRVVIGAISREDGQRMDVVIFVPHDREGFAAPFQYYVDMYNRYWLEYETSFNMLPLDERKARIAAHDEAVAARRMLSRKSNLTTDARTRERARLESEMIRGPFGIDRRHFLLDRR